MTVDNDAFPREPRTHFNETRPFIWSIRRELWENRSLYLAPLIVAGVVLFTSLMMTLALPHRMRNLSRAATAGHSLFSPIEMAPAPIMLTTILVGFFYSLDALYGERRDRSILFWKSLPISDRTTVLSKMAVPVAVLPAVAIGLSVIVQSVLMFAGTVVLAGSGNNPGRLWAEVRFFEGLPIMVYGMVVHALWFAPLYAWLLLISAWAKRSPILWMIIPSIAISIVERMLHTSAFQQLIAYRLKGAMQTAFSTPDGNIERLSQLTPIRFLTTPGLWLGLAFAALCLAAAIRLRRMREPI